MRRTVDPPWLTDGSSTRQRVRKALRRWSSPRARVGLSRRPVSDIYGLDRGTPVDRFYIDGFIAENSPAIQGSVMEIFEGRYAHGFGSGDLDVEVVDIDPNNPRATLVADLCEPGSLPTEGYDCAIVTQTLHVVARPEAALRNIWQSLRPGGVALISTPCICRLDGGLPDRWRWTPRGFSELVASSLPDARFSISGAGNLTACSAFLRGAAIEEIGADRLRNLDARFPLVVLTRLQRG